MPEALPPDQIAAALRDLPGWSHADGMLRKRFTFADFPEAMSFMVRVGFAAESANHHPQFTNVYNRVDVGLATHDADDSVTQKDIDLAQRIEAINWLPEK